MNRTCGRKGVCIMQYVLNVICMTEVVTLLSRKLWIRTHVYLPPLHKTGLVHLGAGVSLASNQLVYQDAGSNPASGTHCSFLNAKFVLIQRDLTRKREGCTATEILPTLNTPSPWSLQVGSKIKHTNRDIFRKSNRSMLVTFTTHRK